VVTLSSFLLHPRGIDYLDSAGILADNFRVVVIGTPQGTSKDHAAPAIQPPRGLYFACCIGRPLTLATGSDPLKCRSVLGMVPLEPRSACPRIDTSPDPRLIGPD
jgi:hypothetical protein